MTELEPWQLRHREAKRWHRCAMVGAILLCAHLLWSVTRFVLRLRWGYTVPWQTELASWISLLLIIGTMNYAIRMMHRRQREAHAMHLMHVEAEFARLLVEVEAKQRAVEPKPAAL